MCLAMPALTVAEPVLHFQVRIVDGVVMPRRLVGEAIAEALAFLKKADGGYVPGRIDSAKCVNWVSPFQGL